MAASRGGRSDTVIGILQEGDCFGEPALTYTQGSGSGSDNGSGGDYGSGRVAVSVVAVTKLEVLTLSKENFDASNAQREALERQEHFEFLRACSLFKVNCAVLFVCILACIFACKQLYIPHSIVYKHI